MTLGGLFQGLQQMRGHAKGETSDRGAAVLNFLLF